MLNRIFLPALLIFSLTACESALIESSSPARTPTGSEVSQPDSDSAPETDEPGTAEDTANTDPQSENTPEENTETEVEQEEMHVTCEGDLTVSSLEDAENISNCDIITGTLSIQDYQEDALASLSVTEIHGSLYVANSPGLTHLDGLSSLESVGEHIKITDNLTLLSIEGLHHIAAIPGELYVMNNPMLTNLEGLESLEVVSGRLLKISGNSISEDLAGLGKLREVSGALSIWGNPLLTSLDGLQSLDSVGAGEHGAKNLEVNYNDSLTQVSALSQLEIIFGDLQVAGNPVLESLQGLTGLTRVDGSFVVINNSQLDQCEVLTMHASIESMNGIQGEVTIFGNADEGECDPPETE